MPDFATTVPATHTRPLAQFGGARPPAPAWFRQLMAMPMETGAVHIDGTRIEHFSWGQRGAQGVLLVHGNRAHARWWGPVAPLLARAGLRVAALSFSGMGGSGWRDAYHTSQMIEEMFGVIEATGLHEGPARPFVVAHSFGASIAALAARSRGHELSGTILVDSSMGPTPPQHPADILNKPRHYPTLEAGLARFRLLPEQNCDNAFILDEVARLALAEAEGGWRWCFDPSYWTKLTYENPWPAVSAPLCKLAFLYGETSSLVTEDCLALQRQQAPETTPFIGIPEAGHHVMMDQPFALGTAIHAILACWLPDTLATGVATTASLPADRSRS